MPISTQVRRILSFGLWLWLALPLAAQEAPQVSSPAELGEVLDAETGLVRSLPALVVEPMALADGWLELTPLASEAAAVVIPLDDRSIEDGELRLPPPVEDGAAMLCSGGRSLAALCEQVYVQREVWAAPDAAADVAIRFELGLAVEGRYLLDGWPIAGARVALVPAG
ncbi:MAG: hypothetical protein AAF657_40785, partial [Acidobacteriota bacterium]